jgi:hypothetical protein
VRNPLLTNDDYIATAGFSVIAIFDLDLIQTGKFGKGEMKYGRARPERRGKYRSIKRRQ